MAEESLVNLVQKKVIEYYLPHVQRRLTHTMETLSVANPFRALPCFWVLKKNLLNQYKWNSVMGVTKLRERCSALVERLGLHSVKEQS